MPIDPAMMGGAPAQPAAPAMDPAMLYDMVVQAVRQVMQEMGGAPGAQAANAPEKKKATPNDRLDKIEAVLSQLGIPLDQMEGAGAASGFSSGSGMPADGGAAMPMMGPLDPRAGAAMASMGGASMAAPKAAGFRPLDKGA